DRAAGGLGLVGGLDRTVIDRTARGLRLVGRGYGLTLDRAASGLGVVVGGDSITFDGDASRLGLIVRSHRPLLDPTSCLGLVRRRTSVVRNGRARETNHTGHN